MPPADAPIILGLNVSLCDCVVSRALSACGRQVAWARTPEVESGIFSARYCGTRDFRGFAMRSRPLFSQVCPPHSHENSHLTSIDENPRCRVTSCHYRRPRRLGWPRTPDFQSARAGVLPVSVHIKPCASGARITSLPAVSDHSRCTTDDDWLRRTMTRNSHLYSHPPRSSGDVVVACGREWRHAEC